MASAGTVIISQILAAHGARADVRLWRNERGGFWTGKRIGDRQGPGGRMVTLQPASVVMCGLFNGAPDIIGFWSRTIYTPTDGDHVIGRFVGIEVKAPGDRMRPEQTAALEMLRTCGCVGIVATCVADVDAVLGKAPKP